MRFTPSPESVRRQRAEKAKEAGVFAVALMGRAVPVLHTAEGLRAVGKDQKPVAPESVEKYLKSKCTRAVLRSPFGPAGAVQERSRRSCR